MKSGVTLIGGMDDKFISQIARSRGVSDAIAQARSESSRDAEGGIRAKYPKSGFRYFYGATRLGGAWGVTWVIFPRNGPSVKNPSILTSAVARNTTHRKSISN